MRLCPNSCLGTSWNREGSVFSLFFFFLCWIFITGTRPECSSLRCTDPGAKRLVVIVPFDIAFGKGERERERESRGSFNNLPRFFLVLLFFFSVLCERQREICPLFYTE